jgi:hypothetical protein
MPVNRFREMAAPARQEGDVAAVANGLRADFPLTRSDLAKPRPGGRRRVRFHDLHLVHARVRGTTPACRAKRLDGVRRTGEESLDIAVQTVSYPAPNAACASFHFYPGAVADALDIAADRQPGRSLSRSSWPRCAVVWMDLSAGEFDAMRFDPENGEDGKRHGDDRGDGR